MVLPGEAWVVHDDDVIVLPGEAWVVHYDDVMVLPGEAWVVHYDDVRLGVGAALCQVFMVGQAHHLLNYLNGEMYKRCASL